MADKTKYIIVGSWQSKPTDYWYTWIKKILESQPNSEVKIVEVDIIMKESMQTLNEKVGVDYLDENTYLIGHSLGCQQIMRWLATVDVQVGGMLLVAGWMDLQKEDKTPPLRSIELIEFLKTRRDLFIPWLTTPFDGKKAASNAKKIVVMISDNDEFTWKYQQNKAKFLETLPGCTVKIFSGKGTFMNSEEPLVLDELEKLKK
jgi:predicted alpha/beta hydrolase family esterase